MNFVTSQQNDQVLKKTKQTQRTNQGKNHPKTYTKPINKLKRQLT